MNARDLLVNRRKELEDSISAVRIELAQIDRALRAMDEKPVHVGQALPVKPATPMNHSTIRHVMPVNDAIVLAVEAGAGTPVNILSYLKDELGIDTTLNSVRSRVSPLKAEGRIAHDGRRWIPAQKNEAPNGNAAGASQAGEEGVAPPDSPSSDLLPGLGA